MTDLNQAPQETLEPQELLDQEAFHKQLQDLVENPDLQVIANVVVNLLAEQTGQIQTNVIQAVFMNTILEMLVEAKVIDYNVFMKKHAENLKEAEATVQKTFEDAHKQAVDSQEEPK